MTGFSPKTGPSGTVVSITGTNFTCATSVSFHGTAAAFTVVSASQINATVADGTTTGAFFVTTPGGTASSTASFTVTPLPTMLAVANVSGRVGQRVSLTATLTSAGAGISGGGGISGKTVTFKVGGAAVGTATTSASGVATFAYTLPATPEIRSLAASFAGGADASASAGTGTLTVTAAVTSVSVTSAAAYYYQTVTLTATLTSSGMGTGGGAGISGKTLTFKVDRASVGTVSTSASGVATFAYTNAGGLAPGDHAVAAAFTGSASYTASSGMGTLMVTQATRTLTVTAVSAKRGATATLSATLRRASDGAPLPGRSVTFQVDSTVVGTGMTNGSGVATWSYAVVAGQTVGAHVVLVKSAAETDYVASSSTGTLTVH